MARVSSSENPSADAAEQPIVTVERRGVVSIIHLDDGRANAVSFELCQLVTDAVRAAEADDDVKAVVLHGREARFSGGFDLNVMRGGDAEAISNLCADGVMLAHALYSSKVPVVIACTGHALAMGALLLCGADVRVGTAGDFKIGMNELLIGMSLPDWALTLLEERLNRRHLQRATMTAHVYSPAAAIDAGYLDEVVPAEQVLERSVEIATALGETLHPAARWLTLKQLRGAVLDRVAAQAEAFRNGGTL